MDYCPEIALLHGAFACIEAESKDGKYDLLHHTKGDKSSRPFELIKDVVQEIVAGPDVLRGPSEQKKWSRHLHHILFCKAFVFNKQFASREMDEEKCGTVVMSYKAWCLPIPDLHPHLLFDLADEFGWSEFLGELTAVVDLPTALTFVRHSLAFCTPPPAVFYDLSLMSTTLDVLLSLIVSEFVPVSEVESQSARNLGLKNKDVTSADRGRKPFSSGVFMSQERYQDLNKRCHDASFQSEQVKRENEKQKSNPDLVEEKGMDHTTKVEVLEAANLLLLDHILEQLDQDVQDNLTQIIDLALETLKLVQKRMSTKLFSATDRGGCKKDTVASVLPVLGRILSSVIVFCVLSVFDDPSHVVKLNFVGWLLKDEDEESDCGFEANAVSGPHSSSESDPSQNTQEDYINLVAEAFSLMTRTSQARTVCLKCLCSFFAIQHATKGESLQKLSTEKSVKFGRVLKLNYLLGRFSRSLKLVRVVRTFSQLLAQVELPVKESQDLMMCMLSIVAELERREKKAEEKQLNPSLADVLDKVEKRLPRWKYCLQYGLAKRDLKDWWFAGFLDLLLKESSLLSTEADFRHLLVVFQQISDDHPGSKERDLCAELIATTFAPLPSVVQEKILLETYRDSTLTHPGLQIVSDYEQTLMVAFNKLSANSAHEDLCEILPLALHDLLTFTNYAVSTAINSEGHIPVVVKVFQLVPGVMQSVHPLRHPSHSLLCHCLHSVLQNRSLFAREQTNYLNLVSALVKPTYTGSSQNPLLLPAAEFLDSCVLPIIIKRQDKGSRPLGQLALRVLLSCLEATLSVGLSAWLEEICPPVIVSLCGDLLQDCLKWACMAAYFEHVMTTRVLVLDVVDTLLKHFAEGGITLDERSGWLQKGFADWEWTVCVYLGPFLGPYSSNKLIAEYVALAMESVSTNPAPLLQLSAISDAAAQQMTDAMSEGLRIPQTALIFALSEVLPAILVREAQRIVRVLTMLVKFGCVDMELHHRSLLYGSILDLTETRTEMVVCQLLTEAVVVKVKREEDFGNTLLLHHLCQVLVAALQTLTQSEHGDNETELKKWLQLKTAVFHQVCAVMGEIPDTLVDPLGVLLLDLLSAILRAESQDVLSSSSSSDIRCILQHGIDLIRNRNCADMLKKKLIPQDEKSLGEEGLVEQMNQGGLAEQMNGGLEKQMSEGLAK